MDDFDLLLRGRVVTPQGIVDGGWVAINGERIAAVGSGGAPRAAIVNDYGDSFVMPGVIDGQTHAGSQFGFAGLEQTTMSAIAGGVTTIVDMPYDQPDPTVTRAILDAKIDAANRLAYCDVALYGTITNSPDRATIASLVEGGVCAFKISSFENHPTRFPRIDNGAAMVLLETLAATDLPIGLHNEDQEIVKRTTAQFIAEGKTAAEFHSPSRPESAELLATANFMELGAQTGAHVHIVHISTPDGFDMVRRYRQAGVRATAEMCIHYLHFDAAVDIPRLGAVLKVNPPIRPHRRDALWRNVELGDVAFVSSDHSAWPFERKTAKSIFEVAAGVPGLETLLPVFFSDVAANHGLERAALDTAAFLADKPARFFGLKRKGVLAAGYDADVVVMKPGQWNFDATKTHDGLGWSPYDGEAFAASPTATFVRGRHVWNETILGAPGQGRFVPRG